MKFSPENDLRMIFKLDPEEIDNFVSLAVDLKFRFTFTKQVFEYQFYNLKDILADIGGIGGAIGAALGSFGVYMIMLFIVDLVIIIQKKYKQEKRTHNIRIYGKKLKLYIEVIQAKMEVIKGTHAVEGFEHNHQDGEEGQQHEGGKVERPTQEEKKTWGEQKLLEADLKMAKNLDHQIDPHHEAHEEEEPGEENVDKDELLDIQEEELIELEERYGDKYKKFNIKHQMDIFDDLIVTKKLYGERTRYKFMKIAELIKKRISFFGIYSLNDQVDMTQEKLGHMRK